jgi:hypothetical protein
VRLVRTAGWNLAESSVPGLVAISLMVLTLAGEVTGRSAVRRLGIGFRFAAA